MYYIINHYKKTNIMKTLFLISLVRFLRFFTTKTFDFILCLVLFMIVPFLAKSILLASIALACHFSFFTFFYADFRKGHDTDSSYNDYTDAIRKLKNGEKIGNIFK